MIEQYLSNTNKIATVLILLKILEVNKAQECREGELPLLSPLDLFYYARMYIHCICV
jgi:hypothetical protein